MKKILMIGLVLLLTACTSGNEIYKFSTGSTGGIYYPYGSRIAELLSDELSYTVNAYTGNASVSNSYAVSSNQMDMALIQSNVAYWAYQGMGMFEEEHDNLRGITCLYPETIQIIVKNKGDIHELKDLKNKRISIGLQDSGIYFDALNVIEASGLTLDDFEEKYLSFSDAYDAFLNDEIEAIFITSGVPTTSIELLNAKADIRILELNSNQLNTLASQSFYIHTILPEDTYQGIGAVKTVSTQALWVVSQELDEDIVYEMTKTFWSNKSNDELSVYAEYLDIEKALEGMSIPLHEGAKRYYKEMGIKMD